MHVDCFLDGFCFSCVLFGLSRVFNVFSQCCLNGSKLHSCGETESFVLWLHSLKRRL